jgi:hypothetical protein
VVGGQWSVIKLTTRLELPMATFGTLDDIVALIRCHYLLVLTTDH